MSLSSEQIAATIIPNYDLKNPASQKDLPLNMICLKKGENKWHA